MNDLILLVTAQYEENYGYPDGGPEHWKPKGEVIFNINLNSELWLYYKDEVEETVRNLVAKKCNKACRYSVVNFDFQLSEPTVLNGFEEEFDKVIKQNYEL